MKIRRQLPRPAFWLTAIIAAVISATLHATAPAPAGLVLLTTGQASAQQSGQPARTLTRRTEVYVGDTLSTGNESQLQVRMKDGALIALGANAEFVIKTYSDDNQGDRKDAAVLSLVKGGLRTITGQIDKSAYRMETPTATLGIRGTVFDVFVKPDGTTVVILRDGGVDVNGNAGGLQKLTAAGLASIIAPGRAPSEPGTPPQDVLDYLRGILPDLPDNITWQGDGNGNTTFNVGDDLINIINDHPPEINGDGSVPIAPGCAPNDYKCLCADNPRQCG